MSLRCFFIVEIFFATIFAVTNVLLDKYYLSFILKVLCSFGFVLTSLYCVKKNNNKRLSLYSKAILIGQILSFGGDALLQIDLMNSWYFVLGLFSFVCAHFCYIVGLCVKTKIEPMNILVFIVLSASFILCSTFCPAFDYRGLFPAVSVYGIIVLFMFSKSLSFYRFRAINFHFSFFPIVGMSMTFIADFLIMFVLFIPTSPVSLLSVLNLISYYIGQECIAISLYYDDIDIKRIE